MERLNEKDFANVDTSNDLYERAKAAIAAGLSATVSDYIKMDKETISPNDSDKALYGDDAASQGALSSGRTREEDTKKVG